MSGSNFEGTRRSLSALGRLIWGLVLLLATLAQYLSMRGRPKRALVAENLSLRKQLALFREREAKPRRADAVTLVAMVWLSKTFDSALGPGLPDPPSSLPVQLQEHRHKLPPKTRVSSREVLGGLHHAYALQRAA